MPQTTRYLAVIGGKVAYGDDGRGSLVICVPSLGPSTWTRYWRTLFSSRKPPISTRIVPTWTRTCASPLGGRRSKPCSTVRTKVPSHGADHYPHAEMPERVGPEIVRFLLSKTMANAA